MSNLLASSLTNIIQAEGNIHESAKALLFYAIKCHLAICEESSRLREFDARGVWTIAWMNLRSTYPSTLHAIGLLRRLLGMFGASQLCYPPLIDKLQTPSDNLRLLASLLGATSPRIDRDFQVMPLLKKYHLYQGINIVASSQKYTEYMPKLFLAPPHVLVSYPRELHKLLSITGKLYAEKLFSYLNFS
ncbi:uncharacterized protein F5Z01DRAFT_638067 [Emericellopsis atlantica]|uniref:Uncharacterized protein n=1 Tax=Emericellopsis atlantica TaxID=2614577 RepID=A0A9P7ZJL7_9HYPO|nr:uncharacterized protein F5Z01DRAFT_638067 [Emericellopsis atlantica]KAG9252906.1 hypothetical protein F5Z01DRAFT_638067 [Emericellopsis atlantica]